MPVYEQTNGSTGSGPHTHPESDVTGLVVDLASKAVTVHNHDSSYEPINANIQAHIASTSNPHSTNKTQVGLSNVDNTSDANKPISSAMQTALNLKESTANKGIASGYASLDSGIKIPIVQLPTGSSSTTVTIGNDSRLSDARTPLSHTHTESEVTNLVTDLASKAPLASPTFTGTVSGITKAMVGLGSVDNTADTSKPVSTAQQSALDAKAALSHTHNTSDINAGTMATARLGSGTANSTTFLRGDQTWATPAGGGGGLGYTLPLVAGVINPANDSEVNYWGSFSAKSPDVTANRERVYIPKAGTIKGVNVVMYAGTAGTGENISLHIGLNNTTFTLVATVGTTSNPRIFTNNALSIPVVVGDYIAMRWTFPVWATNPSATYVGGTVYIE